MRVGIFAAAAAFLAPTLAGCAATQSTEQVVLRYNRAFAQSRNEVLLLNILRASAREPLQFSAMGTVSGSIGNGGEISIPFTNILVGGQDSISPTLRITDAVNPSISIAPLAYKEFVSGILGPVEIDDLRLFIHSGWDAEFLLPLVVGGVVCGDGRMLLNSGEYADEEGETAESAAFREFFRRSAANFAIRSAESDPSQRLVYERTDDQLLELLREGVGQGRTISRIEQRPGGNRVTIVPTASPGLAGMDIAWLCGQLPETRLANRGNDLRVPEGAAVTGAVRTGAGPSARERVILRSVASIIHFLGESHRVRFRASTPPTRGLTYFSRSGSPQTLFALHWGASAGRRAVSVGFHDVDFWVPAIDLRAEEPDDRTLKTLSFLDQLIALQTSSDVVRGTQPLITVGGQ